MTTAPAEPIADAEVVDPEPAAAAAEPTPASTELAHRQASGSLELTPSGTAADLKARLDVIKEVMETAMIRDVDYGVIPGGGKPALLKPGAEKLGVLFQLDVDITDTETYGPGDHYSVKCDAIVYHAPTRIRLGDGAGSCTTREKKYGKRKQDRACPNCAATTIKRSKFNDNGGEPGWYCFAKIGGCGAQFDAGDQRIAEQPVGDIENPDLPDTYNTVLKMARKRARVDAVLNVTGASALFTQDVDETVAAEPAAPPPAELPKWATPVTNQQATDLANDLQAIVGDGAGELIQRIGNSAGHIPKIAWAYTKALRTALEARAAAAAQDTAAEGPPAGQDRLDVGPAGQGPPAASAIDGEHRGGPELAAASGMAAGVAGGHRGLPGDYPQAGTVEPPNLFGIDHPVSVVKRLREAGCICADPLNDGTDDRCALKGHGIPF